MRRIAGLIISCIALGCGASGPPPGSLSSAAQAPPALQPLPDAYRLRIGDELSILVLDQPELSGTAKVMPDGQLTAPGVTVPLTAAGRTVPEVRESVRDGLARILRYPDVSVMLRSYVAQQIYVFGEVRSPGTKAYTPQMTALHALGVAAGGTQIAKLSNVFVLRRTGPTEMDVYRLDLSDALHGQAQARDLYLEPYDVVFVPRTVVGNINLFLRQWIGNNMVPVAAYLEGWRAFHVEDWRSYDLQ